MLLEVLGSSGREVRDVFRAATPTHRRLRDHLVTIAVATIGIDLICATQAFLLERHSQETEIKTFGSAVFWTTTQLLTVSSQIKNPISAGGRALDVFMEIWAVTVIATLAGALGSFLQKRGQEIDESADAGPLAQRLGGGLELAPPGRYRRDRRPRYGPKNSTRTTTRRSSANGLTKAPPMLRMIKTIRRSRSRSIECLPIEAPASSVLGLPVFALERQNRHKEPGWTRRLSAVEITEPVD